MRYRLRATFQEEQRKGFVTTHQIDKEFDNNEDLNNTVMLFLQDYNHEYCNQMDFHVTEKN